MIVDLQAILSEHINRIWKYGNLNGWKIMRRYRFLLDIQVAGSIPEKELIISAQQVLVNDLKIEDSRQLDPFLKCAVMIKNVDPSGFITQVN